LFQSPDVVIFDDLNSIGTDHYDHITQLSEAMPDANLLYFKNGRNPFENGTPEEQAIFPRMANANSKFTVHARLRELGLRPFRRPRGMLCTIQRFDNFFLSCQILDVLAQKSVPSKYGNSF